MAVTGLAITLPMQGEEYPHVGNVLSYSDGNVEVSAMISIVFNLWSLGQQIRSPYSEYMAVPTPNITAI